MHFVAPFSAQTFIQEIVTHGNINIKNEIVQKVNYCKGWIYVH